MLVLPDAYGRVRFGACMLVSLQVLLQGATAMPIFGHKPLAFALECCAIELVKNRRKISSLLAMSAMLSE